MNNIFRISEVILLILSIFLIYSCEVDKPGTPIITTAVVTEITQTTSISGGDVTNEGVSPVVSRGICWNISANPTIANSKIVESGGSGAFTCRLTQLTPNTLYYIRAYASNSVGTGYGNQVSFTTSQIAAPVLTTTPITSINETTAVSGGNITDDKGGSITARGVCWSTITNPTLVDSKTIDGTGTGSFTSTLTELNGNTTYYVRAYATNSAGTGYGSTNEFTTTITQPVLPPAGSMTIDFSNFTSSKKGSEILFDQKGTENGNWEFAATVAAVWNVILTINLAVPVSSFKLAVDQDPVFLEDKTWQWSYNVSVLGVTYKARLTGQIMTSDVEWTMYVSSANITEFIWFEGTSKLDGTGGQWILNESASSPTPLLQIDWTKTSNTIGSIKYTYFKNTTFKNSYIEYGLTTGDLDAFYTIHYHNGTKFSDVDIKWNTSEDNGRVRCSDYLLGEWYCWDANKINVICP